MQPGRVLRVPDRGEVVLLLGRGIGEQFECLVGMRGHHDDLDLDAGSGCGSQVDAVVMSGHRGDRVALADRSDPSREAVHVGA